MSTLSNELEKVIDYSRINEGLIIFPQYKPGRKDSPIHEDKLPPSIKNKIVELANKMVDNAYSDNLTNRVEKLSSDKKDSLENHINKTVEKANGIFLGSYKSIYDTIRACGRIEYNDWIKEIIEFFKKLNNCKDEKSFKALKKEANSDKFSNKSVIRRCNEKIDKVYNKCIEIFDKDIDSKIERKLQELADKCKEIINSNILKTTHDSEVSKKAANVAQTFRNVKLVCEYKNKELNEDDIKLLDEIFSKNNRQWKEFTNEKDYKNLILPANGKTNWVLINLISSYIQIQDGFNFDKSINNYVGTESVLSEIPEKKGNLTHPTAARAKSPGKRPPSRTISK